MTKITADLVDDLMCDETLHNIVDGKPTGFQMLFYVTFAQYHKALEAQAGTAATPEPEPESETDFEPGLCPVAEQVAYLTEQVATLAEKLDCAIHRITELNEVSEVHHDILEMLTNITEAQTNSIASVIEVVHAAMQEVSGDTGRTAAPGMGTPMDVKQILAYILGELPEATK